MTDQTQTTTEPVAWRVKDYADGWILFHNEAPARKSGEARNGALVQPLYTTPQPLAIGLDREAVARVVSQAVADADDVSNRIHKGGYRANLSDVECLRNHVRRLALAAPAEVNGHVASALLWFGSQHNLELSYGYEVDGEGDDGWQVHRVNGGRNDREWTRLSFGHDTPIKAIVACLPAAPTEETGA